LKWRFFFKTWFDQNHEPPDLVKWHPAPTSAREVATGVTNLAWKHRGHMYSRAPGLQQYPAAIRQEHLAGSQKQARFRETGQLGNRSAMHSALTHPFFGVGGEKTEMGSNKSILNPKKGRLREAMKLCETHKKNLSKDSELRVFGLKGSVASPLRCQL